jgi:hypothetical protein
MRDNPFKLIIRDFQTQSQGYFFNEATRTIDSRPNPCYVVLYEKSEDEDFLHFLLAF